MRKTILSVISLIGLVACTSPSSSVSTEIQTQSTIVADITPTINQLRMLEQLIGQSLSSDRVSDFIAEYGCRPGGSDGFYNCYKHGIAIIIKNDIVKTVQLYESETKFEPYTGILPEGLLWSDTKEDVIKKLGDPSSIDKSVGDRASYELLNLHLRYDQKESLDMVVIR